METCQLADLPRGARYLDNGGDEFIVTDLEAPCDGYSYTVGLDGALAGKAGLVANSLRLTKDDSGRWYVCPILNGWVVVSAAAR